MRRSKLSHSLVAGVLVLAMAASITGLMGAPGVTITIASPKAGARVSGVVDIQASIRASTDITYVLFGVDGDRPCSTYHDLRRNHNITAGIGIPGCMNDGVCLTWLIPKWAEWIAPHEVDIVFCQEFVYCTFDACSRAISFKMTITSTTTETSFRNNGYMSAFPCKTI